MNKNQMYQEGANKHSREVNKVEEQNPLKKTGGNFLRKALRVIEQTKKLITNVRIGADVKQKCSMRKYFVTAIMSVALLVFVSETAFAQSKKEEKNYTKAREKQYKEKINEYQKEGWKLAGGSRTLEVALLEHYKKTNDPKNKELSGKVSHCKSINVCRQTAINNAQNDYASRASANIKGRIASLLRGDDDMPETEIDKMIAAFEKSVQADVSGALVESYSIV
jgi:hypothetical protein